MIKFFVSFFRGLRGKLTLTYTLTTVLALLALEILVLSSAVLITNFSDLDKQEYFGDVIITLNPPARRYLQTGKEDLPGLQAWLDEFYAAGIASQEPMDIFDSPQAFLVESAPVYMLDPSGVVLAQAPNSAPDLVGQVYTARTGQGLEEIIERAGEGNYRPMDVVHQNSSTSWMMAVPIHEDSSYNEVVGILLITLSGPPPVFYQLWPTMLFWVAVTGLLLLIAVAPFGALFGLIMSTGLTRRLRNLSAAADAWSQGDFSVLPSDRSKDEIATLGVRMRHMAERVQNLLQTQQELAMLEERSRLARDLHDTVKQQAFATLMQLRAARNTLPEGAREADEHLAIAEEMLKSTQQELGQIIAELRPAALEGQGLAAALRTDLENWSRRTRIPANLSVQNEQPLPLPVEQALYRVAQEALSNAARHSSASALEACLAYEPGLVTLTIRDNGVGFNPTAPNLAGFGLQSMRERLAGVGGRLDIQSAAGEGTALTARVPLR